jgi:hypothetical protein
VAELAVLRVNGQGIQRWNPETRDFAPNRCGSRWQSANGAAAQDGQEVCQVSAQRVRWALHMHTRGHTGADAASLNGAWLAQVWELDRRTGRWRYERRASRADAGWRHEGQCTRWPKPDEPAAAGAADDVEDDRIDRSAGWFYCEGMVQRERFTTRMFSSVFQPRGWVGREDLAGRFERRIEGVAASCHGPYAQLQAARAREAAVEMHRRTSAARVVIVENVPWDGGE